VRPAAEAALDRLRALCEELPATEERLSHGTPAFFARGRMFVQLWDRHHDDGRLALWCAAPPLAQETLIESEPEAFFRPPYVGVRGWVGVRLDRGLEWERVARIVAGAHDTVSRPRRDR
jgi:hypothetical protein